MNWIIPELSYHQADVHAARDVAAPVAHAHGNIRNIIRKYLDFFSFYQLAEKNLQKSYQVEYAKFLKQYRKHM